MGDCRSQIQTGDPTSGPGSPPDNGQQTARLTSREGGSTDVQSGRADPPFEAPCARNQITPRPLHSHLWSLLHRDSSSQTAWEVGTGGPSWVQWSVAHTPHHRRSSSRSIPTRPPCSGRGWKAASWTAQRQSCATLAEPAATCGQTCAALATERLGSSMSKPRKGNAPWTRSGGRGVARWIPSATASSPLAPRYDNSHAPQLCSVST